MENKRYVVLVIREMTSRKHTLFLIENSNDYPVPAESDSER